MVEQLLNHIRKNGLASPEDKVLLAVSGGIDSMAMLKLFGMAGFTIGVAHCNFQLRGGESDADESFVRDAAKALGIPFFTKKFEVAAYAEGHGLSTQMAARNLRYEWFDALIREEGYDRLATAHHLGDSIETILMNLARGTGFEGISGIKSKSGYVIRPMLFTYREEILAFAQANSIEWREDSSNDGDDYQRNFTRHEIVPLLKKLNPSFDETFKDTYERLVESGKLLRDRIDFFRKELVVEDQDRIIISIEALQQHNTPLLVMWELIKEYGFNYDQCRAILLQQHETGAKFLSATHQLSLDRGRLIIQHNKESRPFEVRIEEDVDLVKTPQGRLTLRRTSKTGRIDPSPQVAQLDIAKVKFPLTWRRWQPGDAFVPLGMTGTKKLSDFFVDSKVPLADKPGRSVLVNNDGNILWVVGDRIDDRFKISGDTEEMLLLEYYP